eukprot:CAMPEP_0194267394 /NCGR_PEP_ID=MMETSP0169-20130528/1912_1 /TAXON_ID=218684 /ORGANISM="Corethron pennatum, Strain L29A3" /LENGTH=471 /DNA_ID=CAMNT_0039008219 /DNA_START=135 /DNA_END=1550 /DNA_ORIENTATION=+
MPASCINSTSSHVHIAPQPASSSNVSFPEHNNFHESSAHSDGDGTNPVAKRDRRPKAEKDERRLANSRTIGMGIAEPFPGYIPQVSQLRQAALERSASLSCNSWNREKLVSWLQTNTPNSYSANFTPAKNQGAVRFLWTPDLEARLCCALCEDVSSQDLKLGSDVLGQYWLNAAIKFSETTFQPVNQFSHFVQLSKLAALDPRTPPVCYIDGHELKEKFTELLTKYKALKDEAVDAIYVRKPENIPNLINLSFGEDDVIGPYPEGVEDKKLTGAAQKVKECFDLICVEQSFDTILKTLTLATKTNSVKVSSYMWDIIFHDASIDVDGDTGLERVDKLYQGQPAQLFSILMFDKYHILESISKCSTTSSNRKNKVVESSTTIESKTNTGKNNDSAKNGNGLKHKIPDLKRSCIEDEEMIMQAEHNLRNEIIKLWQTMNKEDNAELKTFISEEIAHLRSQLEKNKAKRMKLSL